MYLHAQDVPLVEFMYLVFTRTGCTSGGIYVPRIYTYRMHIWWSLCTLYLHVQEAHLVEFMYLVFKHTGCTSGGIYVPCIYTYRMYLWWSLCTLNLHAWQVRVTVGAGRGAGGAQWHSSGLVTERSRVRITAEADGEISPPGSTFCVDSYFGTCSTPVLPRLHVKDPSHSAQSAGSYHRRELL